MRDSSAPDGRRTTSSVSRREALRYAASSGLLAGLPTLFAPPASADGLRLVDFTERLVGVGQLKAAGYHGAIVYVSELRPTANFDFKPVTRNYADELRAAGMHVVSCYQYGKPGEPTPSDFTRGHDGGVADAQTALGLHSAAGGPDGAPIFFAVDEDIDQNTWKNVAAQWLRGVNAVLGVARTGVYGHAKVCAWAIGDGLVGHSSTPGHSWAWQTRAWSAGAREPAAVLYQTAVNTPSTPGPLVGGVHVDVDDVLAADFGQWDLRR